MNTTLNNLLGSLSRWLYPSQYQMDPGAFESFLSEVPDLDEIDDDFIEIEVIDDGPGPQGAGEGDSTH